MREILFTIFEVATIVVPLFIAALFLFRTEDSFSDGYSLSYLKSCGFSFRGYKLFYRIIGVIALIVGVVMIYANYILEPENELDESKQFWNEVNSASKTNILSTAMLLGAAIAIPTRMGSTRFPGKPLALLGGKAVIQRANVPKK